MIALAVLELGRIVNNYTTVMLLLIFCGPSPNFEMVYLYRIFYSHYME